MNHKLTDTKLAAMRAARDALGVADWTAENFDATKHLIEAEADRAALLDHTDALAAENARLRTALESIANNAPDDEEAPIDSRKWKMWVAGRIARAALGERENGVDAGTEGA